MHYIEMIIICIIILLIILLEVSTNSNRIECFRPYKRAIFYSIFLGFLNIITYLVEGVDIGFGKYVHYLAHGLSLISICGIYFSWFLYSEEINDSKLVNNSIKKKILAIPFFLTIILVYVSCINGSIFYISDDFKYMSGNYYSIFIVFSVLYFLVTLIHSLIRIMDENMLIYKKKNITIFLFCLFIFFGVLFSIIFFGKPHTIVGITLGVIFSYLSFLDQLITIDPLTQLNNKGNLVNKLTNEIKNYSDSYDLYLLMLDMDDFKEINDTYGHIEGDNAIIAVANILKQVCSNRNCFISRYGGDEFNIMIKVKDKEEIKKLCDDIESKFEEYNDSNKKYELKVSIGYAKYNKKIKNVGSFINIADKDLYRIKKERKVLKG